MRKTLINRLSRQQTGLLRLISESVLLTASIALFWCVIATFPPLRIGIWMDAEGVFIMMNALSAVCALSLGGVFFLEDVKLPSAVVVLISFFAVFLLFSGVMSVFATNTYLHQWGLPQTNEGLASYLNYFMMIVSFSVLLQRGHGAALLVNAVIAAIVITFLTVLNHPTHKILINEDWCPYVFRNCAKITYTI
ncbi:MAG: hypothetical protein V4482_01075 [Pseudomonadota bacterium]